MRKTILILIIIILSLTTFYFASASQSQNTTTDSVIENTMDYGDVPVDVIFETLDSVSGLFEEDFESKTLGDLNTQGNWTGSTAWDVVSDPVHGGTKAASTNSTAASISSTFTGYTEGVQTFYVNLSNWNSGQTNHRIRFYDGTTEAFTLYFNEGAPNGIYLDANGGWHLIQENMTTTAWHKIDLEIRGTDSYGRVRFDDGTWSDYYAGKNTYTEINKVVMEAADGGGSTLSIDDFAGPAVDPPADASSTIATTTIATYANNITFGLSIIITLLLIPYINWLWNRIKKPDKTTKQWDNF